MGKDRSRFSQKASGNSNVSSENVIPLGLFRQRRMAGQAHSVFYISEGGRWLDLLSSITSVRVEDIQNPDALKINLLRCDPELVLLESGIRWADPVETIKQLDYLLEVPIVMICDARSGRNSSLLKQAYSAGAHDTLYSPLKRDELLETLEVLLKFQRQVSLNQ